ncbi:MAG TPA: RHS repeat-associated core domain-containing protein, partial [Ktedonobacterales bacterium]
MVSYLANETLGSLSLALSASGTIQASQLFDPYGNVRYTNGTLPGSHGFTGQHSDSATGLDHYSARYYDPTAGQFTSTDTVLPGSSFSLWGLSRYAWVAGNPETHGDPSGHCWPVCTILIGAVIGGGQCVRCATETFRQSGADTHMSHKLPTTYATAGLPVPALSLRAGLAAGPDHPPLYDGGRWWRKRCGPYCPLRNNWASRLRRRLPWRRWRSAS